MTTEQIIRLVISVCPSVIAIVTTVGVVLRVIKDFKDLKKQVTDMKSVEELNVKAGLVLQENYELKKKINELLTKIDRIERK